MPFRDTAILGIGSLADCFQNDAIHRRADHSITDMNIQAEVQTPVVESLLERHQRQTALRQTTLQSSAITSNIVCQDSMPEIQAAELVTRDPPTLQTIPAEICDEIFKHLLEHKYPITIQHLYKTKNASRIFMTCNQLSP